MTDLSVDRLAALFEELQTRRTPGWGWTAGESREMAVWLLPRLGLPAEPQLEQVDPTKPQDVEQAWRVRAEPSAAIEPLTEQEATDVGRLRAYGNAICPQTAAALLIGDSLMDKRQMEGLAALLPRSKRTSMIPRGPCR